MVPSPDVEGRRQILESHFRNIPLARGVDLSVIARGTPGEWGVGGVGGLKGGVGLGLLGFEGLGVGVRGWGLRVRCVCVLLRYLKACCFDASRWWESTPALPYQARGVR